MLRRRRLVTLLLASAFCAAVVIAVIASSSTMSYRPEKPVRTTPLGAKQTEALLRGLVQRGRTLGNQQAPATIVVFADLKSPTWQAWYINRAKRTIDELVRTGRVALEIRLINASDRIHRTQDGRLARSAAYNAAQGPHLFDFIGLLAYNQGLESDSWVTSSRLQKVVDAARPRAFQVNADLTNAVQNNARNDDALARRLSVNDTPAFFVRKRGQTTMTAVRDGPRSFRRAVRRAAGDV